MSTRYVWEKWNVVAGLVKSNKLVKGIIGNGFIQNTGSKSDDSYAYGNDIRLEGEKVYLTEPITKVTLTAGKLTFDKPLSGMYAVPSGNNDGSNHAYYTTDSTEAYVNEYEISNGTVYDFYLTNCYEYTVGDAKGTTSYGNISSASSGAYPANGKSGSYWYVSKGSDTIDPVSVSYASSIKGGQIVNITISPSIGNVYGGTIKYKVEYQLNGGSWKVANSGTTNTNLSILVPAGTQTFRARATASDNMGFTSTTAVTGATVSVVNNAAPVINCGTSSLGEIAEPFSVTYSVSDEDADTMTITEKIDGTTIRSYSAPSGSSGEQTFAPSAAQWLTTLNGSHTATITADDGKGGVTTHSISFTRAVYTMSVTLEEPMETDDAITKCVVNIARNLPADAEWSLLVTNNAFDPEPVWEDITQYVKNGWNWVFENQTVTSGRYGFNFKLTCARGASGQGGSVDTISGGFE